MILTKQERTAILGLVVASVIAIFVTLYISTTKPKEKLRVNGKIHVINTGGDIEPNFKQKYNENSKIMPYYDMNEYDPHIIASDIIPADWNIIAQDVVKAYANYDAIVIVCGRDTLAYTAAALSFMFENLSKPIVLTDGDLYTALRLSSTTRMCEVMVASENKLLRGCRIIPDGYNTFSSPTYPVLNKYTCLDPPTEKMQVLFVNPKVKIIVIKIFPGMDGKYLESLRHNKMQGIVFETYGTGKSPITEKIVQNIHYLAEKGVIMVSVTQNKGMKEHPETDLRLLEAGVLNGGNMTTYAAFAKLHFLIGNVEDKKIIGRLMEVNYRGEMGPPPVKTLKPHFDKKTEKQEDKSKKEIVKYK